MVGTSVPTVAYKWMVIPMYDELIKRLYECVSGECWNCSQKADDYEGQRTCADKLMKQAADAIENTSKAYQMMAEAYEAEVTKQCWIPVTERLPEYMENVLVTDGVFSGMGWRDYYDCHGTKPREDYWIAPSTNVNELGITHWMPLPQPPESEGE